MSNEMILRHVIIDSGDGKIRRAEETKERTKMEKETKMKFVASETRDLVLIRIRTRS